MRWIRHHLLTAFAMLAFAYLLVPIAVVIMFSLNAPKGRFNYVWQGFTLDNWVRWDAVPGLKEATIKSLEIGLISTLVATALGTLISLALVRHDFRGRGATNVVIFLPMSTPEIVLGASLLTLFINLQVTLGFALSIDDFVITYFNAGSTTTFPLLVWGAARVAVPPQINVVASAIFLIAVMLMVVNVILESRRGRRGREHDLAAASES